MEKDPRERTTIVTSGGGGAGWFIAGGIVVALLVAVILFAGGFFDGSKTVSVDVPDKVTVEVPDVDVQAPAEEGAGSEQ
ncbi:MAG: hypothetical protein RIB55_18355 [Nitratireductor sp.]|jgi:hypothetical protein